MLSWRKLIPLNYYSNLFLHQVFLELQYYSWSIISPWVYSVLYYMNLNCNLGGGGKVGKDGIYIIHFEYLYRYLNFPYSFDSFGHFWTLLAAITRGLGNRYISIRLYLLFIAWAVILSIKWWLVSQYAFNSFLHLVSCPPLIFLCPCQHYRLSLLSIVL